MKHGFYMYLSSDDSSEIHTNNTWHNFTCEFNPEIVLENNCPYGLRPYSWSVALLDLSILDRSKPIQTLPESIAILTDIAAGSYINSTCMPILRTLAGGLEVSTSLAQPYYIDVSRVNFNTIHIEVLRRELSALSDDVDWPKSDSNTTLRCTLHFQKV